LLVTAHIGRNKQGYRLQIHQRWPLIPAHPSGNF